MERSRPEAATAISRGACATLTTQLRRQRKIQGFVYTELADIEWEHNGLVNYDRTPKRFGYETWVPDMRPNELLGRRLYRLRCTAGDRGQTRTRL